MTAWLIEKFDKTIGIGSGIIDGTPVSVLGMKNVVATVKRAVGIGFLGVKITPSEKRPAVFGITGEQAPFRRADLPHT